MGFFFVQGFGKVFAWLAELVPEGTRLRLIFGNIRVIPFPEIKS
jgi:hypothetical protein